MYETSFTIRGATGITPKYCACHAKLHSQILEKFAENSWNVISNARPVRAWSENIRPWSDPENAKLNPPSPPRLLFALARSRFLLKITTFPAPAIIPNFTKCCTCRKKWHMNFTKCCTCHKKWPMNFTKCCACHEKSHMNFTKCCACHEKWHMNFTKCCACHAKWISWLIHITYETSFTMRGATVNTLQPHQILRLPRKMATQHLTEICWKQLKRHFQCATDPSMIREYPTMIRPRKRKTEPAAPPRLLFALARSRFYWKLVSRSGYHSKFHHMLRLPRNMNFTKCCPCHEKWQEVTHDYCYYYCCCYCYYYYYY